MFFFFFFFLLVCFGFFFFIYLSVNEIDKRQKWKFPEVGICKVTCFVNILLLNEPWMGNVVLCCFVERGSC